MRDPSRSWLGALVGLTLIVAVAKLALAARWALLADEAYYWVWSLQPDWGYYDQPPAIAWMLAAERALLGDAPWALRMGPVLCGLVGAAALSSVAGSKDLPLLWWIALPPLAWLTGFATPDAILLAAWAVGVAAACRGGRWWWLAGLAGGVAGLAKYSGLALLPLLVLGAGPSAWRRKEPWGALLLSGLLMAPNLLWNADHDWVSLRFQLHEGLLHPAPPGLWGPLAQLRDQLGVVTPLAWLAGTLWLFDFPLRAWRHHAAPTQVPAPHPHERLAWITAAPLLLGFAVAAFFAPPEAHWTAPAWVSVGLGLSFASGRLQRLAYLGAWVALGLSGLLALHGLHPLLRTPTDPATRLTEGPLLAGLVASWALPEGVGVDDHKPERATPVLTERYQEAALIHYYSGIPARTLPGCGRRDQYDLWAGALPAEALFVRPATSGPPDCAEAVYVAHSGPARIEGVDAAGRVAGVWQVFELRGVRAEASR